MCFNSLVYLSFLSFFYWLLQLVSCVISCMEAMQEHCKDAELNTHFGVECCGLDISARGLVARLQQRGREEPVSLSNFLPPTFPVTLYFFILVHLFFFFYPHNSHSFSAASPVTQHCDTSLASIIPGSNEPTSDNVVKIYPPQWGQSQHH